MARFKKSIPDGLSGKIGPVVTYVRDGVQVVRSLPKRNDPKTEKQLAHRMKFKLVSQGLSPLNNAIKQGYQNGQDAYSTLFSKVYHEAIAGEYPHLRLDYSKILVAEGRLLLPPNIRAEKGAAEQTVLFRWDSQTAKPTDWSRDNDRVRIVYLNESLAEAHQSSGAASLVDGSVSLHLPDDWIPEETLFWIYFCSADQRHHSDSCFVKLT